MVAKLISKAASGLVELGLKGQNIKPRNVYNVLKKAGATDVELTKSGFKDVEKLIASSSDELPKLKEKLFNISTRLENAGDFATDTKTISLLEKKRDGLINQIAELTQKEGTGLNPKGQIPAEQLGKLPELRQDYVTGSKDIFKPVDKGQVYSKYTLPDTNMETYKAVTYESPKFDQMGQRSEHTGVSSPDYQFHVRYDDIEGVDGALNVKPKVIPKKRGQRNLFEQRIRDIQNIEGTSDEWEEAMIPFEREIGDYLENEAGPRTIASLKRRTAEEIGEEEFEGATEVEIKNMIANQIALGNVEPPVFMLGKMYPDVKKVVETAGDAFTNGKPIRRLQEIQSDILNNAYDSWKAEANFYDLSNVARANPDSETSSKLVDIVRREFDRLPIDEKEKIFNDIDELGEDDAYDAVTEMAMESIMQGDLPTPLLSKVEKAVKAEFKPGKEPKQEFNYVQEALKRQAVDAHNAGKEELWININAKGTDKMLRSAKVQKRYESDMANAAKKLAKRIGGKFSQKKGYAIVGLPVAGFSLPLYAAEDEKGQMPGDKIIKSLEAGATAMQIRDFLTESKGMTPEEIDSAMLHGYETKFQQARDAGISEEDIQQHALDTGVVSSLDVFKAEEEELDPQAGQADIAGLAKAEAGIQEAPQVPDLSTFEPSLEGLPLRAEPISVQMSPQDQYESLKNIHATYANTMMFPAISYFSDDPELQANIEQTTSEINQFIADSLTRNGVKGVRVTESNQLVYDDNGTERILDESFLGPFAKSKFELGGSIAGAAAVGVLGAFGGPPGVALGVVAGGAAGGAAGRGLDIVLNALEVREELDTVKVLGQMADAGIADTVMGVLGSGVLGTVKATGRTIKSIWKFLLTKVENKGGAMKALKNFTNLSDQQIETIVAKWENITGNVAEGSEVEQAARAFVETEPGGELLLQSAAGRAKTSGSKLRDQVAERAASVNETVSNLTNENISTALPTRLEGYKDLVKRNFQIVKDTGGDLIEGSDYSFDYDKLAIDPILEHMESKITNYSKLKQFERYMAQIRKLGNKSVVKETIPSGVEGIADTVVEKHPLRDFKNLLELRRVVNEFRGNQAMKSVIGPNGDAIKKVVSKIDDEIAKAAKTKMENGEVWLKQWKTELTEYSKMISLDKNTLYKSLTRPGVDHDKVIKALSSNVTNLDGSFMEVMEKLPTKTRNSAEGAVIKHLTENNTKAVGGKQAIDFVSLSNSLEHMPFTGPKNRTAKRMIAEMADVYKNDPAIMSVLNRSPEVNEGTGFATSVSGKMKMGFIRDVYDIMQSSIPWTVKGRRRALIKQVTKILDNPLDAKATEDIVRMLPEDPEMATKLREMAIEYAKYGERRQYNKQPIYTVTKTGAPKSGDTKFGKGIMYFTDKGAANKAAKVTGSKVSTKDVPPKMIATPDDISRLLGRDVVPSDYKDPKVQIMLRDRDYLGIASGDRVLIFK